MNAVPNTIFIPAAHSYHTNFPVLADAYVARLQTILFGPELLHRQTGAISLTMFVIVGHSKTFQLLLGSNIGRRGVGALATVKTGGSCGGRPIVS